MTEKQKKATLLLNKLFWAGRENMSEEDKENYFLLLEFIIGEKEILEARPFIIKDNEEKSWDYPPITVMYGCGIPDTMITYTSTETNNANKI